VGEGRPTRLTNGPIDMDTVGVPMSRALYVTQAHKRSEVKH
jgi:hypothetical protein